MASYRSTWKGDLAFGPLVRLPVKLYKATEDNDIAFHLLHRQDGQRAKAVDFSSVFHECGRGARLARRITDPLWP